MLTTRSAFDDQSTCPLLNAHTATITRKIEPEPHWGIEDYNAGREIKIEIRQNKYLNNLIEQDHLGVKRIIRPMLGSKSFRCGRILVSGIELMHTLRKGLARQQGQSVSAAQQFYGLAA
jgi:putative transposase